MCRDVHLLPSVDCSIDYANVSTAATLAHVARQQRAECSNSDLAAAAAAGNRRLRLGGPLWRSIVATTQCAVENAAELERH